MNTSPLVGGSVTPMKPVAKIDGLLQFIKDVPSRMSLEEQRAMSASQAGRVLAGAVVRCERHSKEMREARAKLQQSSSESYSPTAKEISALKRDAFLKRRKYVDCLAYMTCPERWNQYKNCWDEIVGSLTLDKLQTWHDQGVLDVVCGPERAALERGVGRVVSSAVQAGASASYEQYTDTW
jgi:hypothetical protein